MTGQYDFVNSQPAEAAPANTKMVFCPFHFLGFDDQYAYESKTVEFMNGIQTLTGIRKPPGISQNWDEYHIMIEQGSAILHCLFPENETCGIYEQKPSMPTMKWEMKPREPNYERLIIGVRRGNNRPFPILLSARFFEPTRDRRIHVFMAKYKQLLKECTSNREWTDAQTDAMIDQINGLTLEEE